MCSSGRQHTGDARKNSLGTESESTNGDAEYLDGVALLQSLSNEKPFCQQLPVSQSSLLTLLFVIIEKKKYYFKFQCINTRRRQKFKDLKMKLEKKRKNHNSATHHQRKCVTLKDYRLVGFLGIQCIGDNISATYMNYCPFLE